MSDPTNTDAATVNTDAQTTSGPAGGDDAAGGFEYPDGSKPPVGEDGLPILEDRSDEFPEEAAAATEVVGELLIETRDGRLHNLGPGSGMSGYRGLAAKRAEKAMPVAPDTDEERQAALALAAEKGYTEADLIDSDGNPLDVAGIHRSLQVEGEGEQGQESGQDAPEGTGTNDDTSEDENGPETGTEAPSEDEESEGDESDDDEFADEGYDPAAHTVTEVSAYLDEHPDQATFVLDRERTGKARVTLIGA